MPPLVTVAAKGGIRDLSTDLVARFNRLQFNDTIEGNCESSEHRHPDGSTNQAYSTCFYFRISLLLMEQPGFFQDHSLWLLQGIRRKNTILKQSIFEGSEAPETRGNEI